MKLGLGARQRQAEALAQDVRCPDEFRSHPSIVSASHKRSDEDEFPRESPIAQRVTKRETLSRSQARLFPLLSAEE
jgi:hypothetical protein